MYKYYFLLPLIACIGFVKAESESLVLTSNSLGGLVLKEKDAISLQILKDQFSSKRVTHEIGSGDSPDFHIFTIATNDGEKIASFISYISSEKERGNTVVPLDEVVVYSPLITDEYGISVGMKLNEAVKLRREMEFGAGHMDNYMGNNKIWYLFRVGEMHGTMVSKEAVIQSNPKIEVISWPYPRWR